MLRSITILATVVAFLFGSLGLPTYLHACRTMGVQHSEASCPACEPEPERSCCSKKAATAGMQIKAETCCSTQTIVQHLQPFQLPKIEMLSPTLDLLFAVQIFNYDTGYCQERSGFRYSTDLPPPVPRHSQDSYLYNSTFLI